MAVNIDSWNEHDPEVAVHDAILHYLTTEGRSSIWSLWRSALKACPELTYDTFQFYLARLKSQGVLEYFPWGGTGHSVATEWALTVQTMR